MYGVAMEGFKTCSMCGERKPLEAFHRDCKTEDQHHGNCKDCRRPRVAAMERRRTAAKRIMLNADIYGKCSICNDLPRKQHHLDHSHATGKHRGVLCVRCNLGLGQFRDRIDLLEQAIVYLKASA